MITETHYKGWKSLSLKTDYVELIMPLDIGPRVISCSFEGGKNLFANVPDQMDSRGEDEWMVRGGHRLWVSPEKKPRTYELDNFPIEVERLPEDRGVLMKGNVDPVSGMRVSILIEVVDSNTFKVTHRVDNVKNAWPVTCAPWALSVMERDGYLAVPFMPKGDPEFDMLPNYSIVPWMYTDFSKPQWQFHRDYLGIDMTQSDEAQKVGLTNYPGWAAYWQEAGTFFLYDPQVDAKGKYPDNGACVEFYTCDFMIEMEMLGQLRSLEQGQCAEYVQYWGIFGDLKKPDTDEVYYHQLKPAAECWAARMQKLA